MFGSLFALRRQIDAANAEQTGQLHLAAGLGRRYSDGICLWASLRELLKPHCPMSQLSSAHWPSTLCHFISFRNFGLIKNLFRAYCLPPQLLTHAHSNVLSALSPLHMPAQSVPGLLCANFAECNRFCIWAIYVVFILKWAVRESAAKLLLSG